MNFDLFEKEAEIIARAEACVESAKNGNDLFNEFQVILSEYKKLSKTSKKIIRIADRNEQELLKANKEISTQKKHLEQTQSELVQAEKLASLGQLVAGVAHEINTPVGIMLTSASSLQKETNRIEEMLAQGKIKKSSIVEYFNIAQDISKLMLRHCQTASELVASFKAVAVDRNMDDIRDFNLHDYINDLIRSIKPSMKSDLVKLEIHCEPDVMMTSYPGALNQILTNIILNAYKHGLKDGSQAGKIKVSVESDEKKVDLTITDTGYGIPADFIDKIFDPFVTSARSSGGTGLGLNIVYNLVTGKLAGKIAVKSLGINQGTIFQISLPKYMKNSQGEL